MNIAVVGSGYVGLVTGACFAEFGVHVTCVDNDEAKIERLLQGEIPIYEPGLGRLVERNKRVKIFGESYEVKARVKTLNGFSAHANATELADLTAPLAETARQAFLVHGEIDHSHP